MSYPVLGIPNASDIPAQSQAQIQTNFNNLISWAAIDHIGYGAVNNGTHNQVTFATATSPTPSPSGTFGVLYSILDSNSASQLLFANKNGSVQLTGIGPGDQVSGSLSGTGGGSYTVFTLPFGFRMFMGSAGIASGARTLTMSASTFGPNIYCAVCSPYGASAMGSSITPTASTSGFQIQSAASAPLYFLIVTN